LNYGDPRVSIQPEFVPFAEREAKKHWLTVGENSGGGVKNFIGIVVLLLAVSVSMGAGPPQRKAAEPPSWAFPTPDKIAPTAKEDENEPRHVPGSTRTYTVAQIDDGSNPPDWFPDEHPPMPSVVAHGSGKDVPGCSLCHLSNGLGHPESANLAGLPANYIVREVRGFGSGFRKGNERMKSIGTEISDAELQQAAQWFASLKPRVWVKVVEAKNVPKTYVGRTRMRFPIPGGGMEPLGDRIIEVPQDPAMAMNRDPHSGFIAYVPVGSIAKGEALVKKGGSGKTIRCAICHGDSLTGLAEVPRIAGISPLYVFRQLYNLKSGDRAGTWGQLMKGVVKNLSEDDMLDISAYLASRTP
jgi:cytochrome c553